MMNHSCAPNVETTYSRADCLVIATTAIKKGEELLVSYIDGTEPSYRRQEALKRQYFFDCKCPKCQRGSATREDEFLPAATPDNAETLKNLRLIEEKAHGLMQESREIENCIAKIDHLESAIQMLHKTKRWPVARFPFPGLRHELYLAYTLADKYRESSEQYCIRATMILPILFPDRTHPVRLMNAWVFVMMTAGTWWQEHLRMENSIPWPADQRFSPIGVATCELQFLRDHYRRVGTAPRLMQRIERLWGLFTSENLDKMFLKPTAYGILMESMQNIAKDVLRQEGYHEFK